MTTLLTGKGMEIVKAELAEVEGRLLPAVQQEMKELKKYYGNVRTEPACAEVIQKKDFYRKRIEQLRHIIANAKVIKST